MCKFYAWNLDYVLQMSARSFFAMHKSMRTLQALEDAKLCDIQAISICDSKYHGELRKYFIGNICASEEPKHLDINPSPGLDGEDAKYTVMQAMMALKSKGYN